MHAHEVMEDVSAAGRELRAHIPAVYDGYSAMAKASMAEGELTPKVKELIALAIAASEQCDGCIAAHARSLARIGATSREVAEAMGVVIMMNGGPGTVWAARAHAAFEEMALLGG